MSATSTSKELILKRLSEEIHHTIAAFRALPPEAWDVKVYTDGAAWTPREILAHQVTTERAIWVLIEDVLAGGEGAPEDLDVRAFNEEQAARSAGRPIEALYAEFEAARAEMIRSVQRMAPEDLARTGRHPWFGHASVEDALKLVYRHNMLHVRDVQRAARAQSQPASSGSQPARAGREGANMQDRKTAIRAYMELMRARLIVLCRRMQPQDWERKVQGDEGHWTAHQVLAHLVSSETGQLATLKGIAEGGEGVREGFDLDRWNEKQVVKEAARSPDELIAALHDSRRQVLSTLAGMNDEQLDRCGRHARGDVISVEDIFRRIAGHEYDHVLAMESALGTPESGTGADEPHA